MSKQFLLEYPNLSTVYQPNALQWELWNSIMVTRPPHEQPPPKSACQKSCTEAECLLPPPLVQPAKLKGAQHKQTPSLALDAIEKHPLP